MQFFDRGKGIGYWYYISIEVDFDRSWRPGSTASFHEVSRHTGDRLFTKQKCDKAFRWKPQRRMVVFDDIIVKLAKDGCERSDVVATLGDMGAMAQRAVFGLGGDAHIEIKHALSFGTSTSWFRVERRPFYTSTALSLTLVLEFANSDDCLGFIRHDLRALESKQLVPNQKYNECLIADNVCQTVAPLASHYRQVELDAIRRGISRNDFKDEYIEPETQLMCHHGSTPSDAHSRPCFLTLHLHIAAWGPHDFEPSFIDSVHWSATNNPCALPALPGPFRSLNSIHLNFPSSAPASPAPDSHESGGNGPSPRGADTLSFTVSEGGIQGLDGSNSAAAGKFITIASEHRNVRVAFINLQGLSVHVNFVSGDAYFGTFNRSNVGGANNVNVVYL